MDDNDDGWKLEAIAQEAEDKSQIQDEWRCEWMCSRPDRIPKFKKDVSWKTRNWLWTYF